MHNMTNISFKDRDDCERKFTVFDVEDSRQKQTVKETQRKILLSADPMANL